MMTLLPYTYVLGRGLKIFATVLEVATRFAWEIREGLRKFYKIFNAKFLDKGVGSKHREPFLSSKYH